MLRRSPRRWWFYFWLATIPSVVFFIFIAPVWIEPLFNKFEPLTDHHADLVAQIERVVQRAGMQIPPQRMFEMKASEKTTELNAYVTGFGATKRVVVWDTTMEHMTTPQTLFVFGHEMGHYVLRPHSQGIDDYAAAAPGACSTSAIGWRTGWWRATGRDGAYAT